MSNLKLKKERYSLHLQFLPLNIKADFPMNKLNLSTVFQSSGRYRIPFAFFLLFFAFFQTTFAQQEPQYTSYMFNTLAYNPAFAGSKDHLSIRALYRDQWYNFGGGLTNSTNDGRPITQSFSMHGNVLKKVGLGLNLTNDRIGARGTTSLDLSYAYRIDFGKGKIALGLQAGVMNWRANWSELSFQDPRSLDPAYENQDVSLWLPSFGAGIYYYHDNFYIGVSIPRLANISLRQDSLRSEVRRWAKTYQHLYFTIGGIFPIHRNIDFKPSLLIKSVGLFSDFLQPSDQIRSVSAPTSFEVNTSFLFYDKLWLGASFRSAIAAFFPKNNTKSSFASANVLFGYQFPEGMRIGFAYDYPLTKIANYTVGSFEVLLGWDFNRKIDKVSHPRYLF